MKKQKTELDVCKAMINRSDSNASGQSYNNCIDWTVQKSDWKDIMGSGLHNIFYFAGRQGHRHPPEVCQDCTVIWTVYIIECGNRD